MNRAVDTDILIVGAGLVGVPLALALAGQGWQVTLLDARSDEPGSACNPLQQRCTALSHGTRCWFEQQDLWSGIAEDAAAIREVLVTHRGHFGATCLRADELGVGALGHVVNNQNMVMALQERLETAGVSHRRGVSVVAVEPGTTSVSVLLDSGERLSASLLLAADGVGSVVRESVGIAQRQHDYRQAAVLSMLELVDDHDQVAHERFTDTGPLALLPRQARLMNVVECIDPTQRDEIRDWDDERYLQHLQHRFGHRLGRFSAVGPRLVLPLVRIEARRQVASRTVLLGNAMRLLHPVGGQGYNLAMRDVAGLLVELQACLGGDPGNPAALARFVASRQADQRRVVRFTDTLARGFRGRAALPGHLRSAALIGLDLMPPLRQRFARLSMGLSF